MPRLVRRVIASSNIPTLPAVAMRLLELGRSPDVGVNEVAGVIRLDPALTARLLEVVNSARYGLRQQVESVDHAAALLGLNGLRSLALGFSLMPVLKEAAEKMPALETVWRRSVIAAAAAQELAKASGQEAETLFPAALLQDLGVLALLAELRDRYLRLLSKSQAYSDLHLTERNNLRTDHAEVGGALAQSWGFPESLKNAIRWHAEPDHAEAPPEARLIAASGLFADTLNDDIDDETSENLATRALLALDELDIERERFNELLRNTRSASNQLLRSFNFETAALTDPITILQQANRGLQDLALAQQARLSHLDVANENLRKEADEDGLTNLLNRRAIETRLDQALAHAAAAKRPISVALIDLDRFKPINDEHGHDAGDRVLVETTNRLSRSLRKDAILGRYGGEEFLLILNGADEKAAYGVAERLRNVLANEPITITSKITIPVTMSLGVATQEPENGPGVARELLARADRALYQAKEDGRNLTRVAEPTSKRRTA
ncbi:sensor domain-containing diguanylate cyclase [Mucisphaera sp.]|uniref:sensor domain-containing diguanylate cyclase n=1 Tax=Mucisphaera sp. TaxID=2913024 RepID=UPI003D0FE0ED